MLSTDWAEFRPWQQFRTSSLTTEIHEKEMRIQTCSGDW